MILNYLSQTTLWKIISADYLRLFQIISDYFGLFQIIGLIICQLCLITPDSYANNFAYNFV